MDALARRYLTDAKAALLRLEAHLEAAADPEKAVAEAIPVPPDEKVWRRWWTLLASVEARGGNLTTDEWRQLGIEHGYDPRGLGGFFRGDLATMRSEGDMRNLTEEGRRQVSRWRRYFERADAVSDPKISIVREERKRTGQDDGGMNTHMRGRRSYEGMDDNGTDRAFHADMDVGRGRGEDVGTGAPAPG